MKATGKKKLKHSRTQKDFYSPKKGRDPERHQLHTLAAELNHDLSLPVIKNNRAGVDSNIFQIDEVEENMHYDSQQVKIDP